MEDATVKRTKNGPNGTVKRMKNGQDRDGRGRFVKGNGGGGRTRQPPEFHACALENAMDALQVLIDIMSNPKAMNSDRIRAAGIIIDRAYGKPDSTVRLESPKAELLDDIRAEIDAMRGAP